MEKQNEIEFDMIELLRYLKKKIWIIALAVVVFAVGAFLVSKLLVTPMYTASSRLYVYREADDMNISGLQTATQLRRDCEILITGENVTKLVVKQLGLNMSPKSLSNRISVSSEENTRIIQVELSDADPERAMLILNAVCRVATEQINSIMDDGNPETNDAMITVVYEADLPTSPTSNAKRNAMLAALLGGVLCAGVLIIVFLLDDTIRFEEDVERYLGLSTLAAIPASTDLGATRKNKGGMDIRRLLRVNKK